MNDNDLVSNYLDGDESSLETLFSRYLRRVYSFVYRMVNNSEDAKDITQDTFVKAWKNLKKFDSDKNFKTWLFVIAKNTTFDLLKKKKTINFSALSNDDSGANSFDVSSEDNSPEEEMIKTEDAEVLESAVSKLPENYRAVVLLRGMEELTFEEISDILDKPLNTVKSQYRRALSLLKTHLSAPK